MRISDWSSDVCSSDLKIAAAIDRGDTAVAARDLPLDDPGARHEQKQADHCGDSPVAAQKASQVEARSEAKGDGRNHLFSILCPEAATATRKSWHLSAGTVSRACHGFQAQRARDRKSTRLNSRH